VSAPVSPPGLQPPGSGADVVSVPRALPALLVTRFFTLANDHALKWLAIGLGKRLVDQGQVSLVLTIGLVGLSLPYVLFSWLAGSLADRRAKTSVIRWAKVAELGIALAATAVVGLGLGTGGEWRGLPVGLWLLLGTVMAIGMQAALMTPAIVGVLPEIVPAARLTAANGVFALVSLIAVLAGTAAGNWLADATPLAATAPAWDRALPTALVIGGIALAGWVASLCLPRLPAADPDAPPAWNALSRTRADLSLLASRPDLAAAAAGIVFFWAIGAVAQANVDQFATEAGASSQAQVVPFLVALVAGIGAGSVVTGKLAARPAGADPRVDLGFVPVGALIMAVSFVALALSGGRFLEGGGHAWGVLAWLAILGFGAGMFDVPLETFQQARSPGDRLGSVLAATNLLLFSGMFLASLGYGALRAPLGPGGGPWLSARAIFGLFAVASVGAAAVAVWCAPRATLRRAVAAVVHAAYRFRVVDAAKMPVTGPLVVVANHVSWLDGFLVALASPRSTRMVVYGPNIQGRFLRMLADQWRFILFDPRPKSIGGALKTIQSGLEAGDLVGIFSEGGISRTGQVIGFKRGLGWLLERVNAPIQPLVIDGLWGSRFSFAEARFFGTKRTSRWRRGVTLTFGPPLPVGTPPEIARLALQDVAATAARQRHAGSARSAATAAVELPAGTLDGAALVALAEAFDGACLVKRGDVLASSLAADDPLGRTLGPLGAKLLGIDGAVIDGAAPAGEIASRLTAARATIWLATVDQVERLASSPGSVALPATLDAVVVPVADLASHARAAAARAPFQRRFGVEPVTALAVADAQVLLAMNTPPARVPAGHEVVLAPDSLGRVVAGAVVWPDAGRRDELGLARLAGSAAAAGGAVAVGAMLPRPGGLAPGEPGALPLAERLAIDGDGFLRPAAAE